MCYNRFEGDACCGQAIVACCAMNWGLHGLVAIGANKRQLNSYYSSDNRSRGGYHTDDATAKAWENARNELLDKAGQSVGASRETPL